jgi:hypothetical protein
MVGICSQGAAAFRIDGNWRAALLEIAHPAGPLTSSKTFASIACVELTSSGNLSTQTHMMLKPHFATELLMCVDGCPKMPDRQFRAASGKKQGASQPPDLG